MTGGLDDYSAALDRAAGHARAWLGSLDDRRVPPAADADAVAARVGGPLPHAGLSPEDVVDLLVAGAEPGLTAMPSGRFFGFVIGGTLPAALAADWLVSAWDQNAGPPRRRRRPPPPWRRWPARGCSTCSACPRAPASGSSPAARWPTSPAWPPPATRCCPGRLGRRRHGPGRGAAGAHGRRRRAARHRRPGPALPRPRAARCAVAVDDQGRIGLDALAGALASVPDGDR